MIILNGKEVKVTRFPDNSIKFDIESEIKKTNLMTWKFESMEELFTLIGLMDMMGSNNTSLYLPYIPNARMDKTHTSTEGFMLKYFVETVDNMGFSKITILDPHSSVYEKFVKKTLWVEDDVLLNSLVNVTINTIHSDENAMPTLVYPDKGARSRYSTLLGVNEDIYGKKERCQKTGKILSFDLIGNIPDGPVLIVDDISSKGGTFYFTAKKLREKGFNGNIYLYITHAEDTIGEGELLKKDSEITQVFTTNSLVTKEMNKLTIMNVLGEDEALCTNL